MACNWNRCKRCGKVSEKEYCKKCKSKISHRKVFLGRHNTKIERTRQILESELLK